MLQIVGSLPTNGASVKLTDQVGNFVVVKVPVELR